MRLIFLCMLLTASACVSQNQSSGDESVDRNALHTFRCPDGWTDCHVSAQRVCGKRGYTELKQHSVGGVVSTGRFEDRTNDRSQGTGIYREDVRQDTQHRALTIRCN